MARAESRRIAAIVLPDLICEIADPEMNLGKVPLAVIEAFEAGAEGGECHGEPGIS